MKRIRPEWKWGLWFGLLVLAVPLLRYSIDVKPAAPLPEHWRLPKTLGDWEGDRIYYSTDPDVKRAFTEQDIPVPGVCPDSGALLTTISPDERRLLPSDVTIDRRIYKGPTGSWRHVVLLITGESREGIHRPEWCLAAQDIHVGDRYFLQVEDPDGGRFAVGVYPLLARDAPEGAQPIHYFVYWFEGPGVKTAYAFHRILRMGLDRLRTGRAQRWAYFSIQMNVPRSVENPNHHITDAVRWLIKNR